MMNLYNLHTDPEKLDGYERRFEIPSFAYEYGKSNGFTDELISVIVKHAKTAADYAVLVGKRGAPEVESLIATDAEAAVKYADKFFKPDGWPLAEPAIAASTAEQVWKYTQVLGEKRFPAGETVIAEDAQYAVIYARIILDRTPWRKVKGIDPKIARKAEQTIAKVPVEAAAYAANVLQKRWPEVEPTIVKNAEAAVNYAAGVFKRTAWHEAPGIDPALARQAEETIVEDGKQASEYASLVLGKRWPEAEPAILKRGGGAASDYAVEVINGRWPEAESAMSLRVDPNEYHDIEAVFEYASKFRPNRRWPELETRLVDHGRWIAWYLHISNLDQRWQEAEPAISTDAESAVEYAKQVLRIPWHTSKVDPNIARQAEQTIATDAELAYEYARYILRTPWHKAPEYYPDIDPNIARQAEETIATNEYYIREYEDYFGIRL